MPKCSKCGKESATGGKIIGETEFMCTRCHNKFIKQRRIQRKLSKK